MFASLVVVLPTQHEGGELVFRQSGQEFIFDAATELKRSSTTAVAFTAFFSDVDHEVTEVRSGYRVTITWNLYFSKTSTPKDTSFSTPFESSMKEALQNLLADTAYLSDGGYIGFGLRHEYPIDTSTDRSSRKVFRSIKHLLTSLKGSDAVLYKLCTELSLEVSLRMVLCDRKNAMEVLCPGNPDLGSEPYYDRPVWETLWRAGGKLLTDGRGFSGVKRQMSVDWITEKRPAHLEYIKTPYVGYGNEAVLGTAYATLVLIVQLGPASARTGKSGTVLQLEYR